MAEGEDTVTITNKHYAEPKLVEVDTIVYCEKCEIGNVVNGDTGEHNFQITFFDDAAGPIMFLLPAPLAREIAATMPKVIQFIDEAIVKQKAGAN